MTRLEVRQVGPSATTNLGDTFTVTLNGTPYTAATGSAQMATGTANRNQVHSEFAAFLSAQFPHHSLFLRQLFHLLKLRLQMLE